MDRDCITIVVKPLDGRYLHRCLVCGKEASFPSDDPARVHMMCGVGDLNPVEGPGREIKLLLLSIGINTDGDCGCADMIRAMNIWGATCLEPDKFKKIEDKLRSSAGKRNWKEKFRHAAAAGASGLALKVNWLDPIPSLIRLAVARAAECQSCSAR